MNSNAESTIQAEIRCALSLKGCICIRQQCGQFLTMDGKRIVHIGIVGISDLLIILPDGRAAWIETKRASGGTRRKEQENFIEQMRKRGCPAGFAKSVQDAIDIIEGRN